MKFYEMNGRIVLVRNFNKRTDNKYKDCADCGSITKLVVKELITSPSIDTWGWCGVCNIG